MDLVSMVANYEEPMEIILLTYHEMKSTVMGFHVYRNKWEPVMGEIITRVWSLKTKWINMPWLSVLDKEKSVIGHLPKGTSGKYAKTIFYFLRNDSVNVCKVKVTGKAVNLGDDKGMRISCVLQLTGNSQMVSLLKEIICEL